MSASETKEDDTLKQVHLPFAKELQLGMLGGLKQVVLFVSLFLSF